jgi:squalene-hopene/tetraprenyl-beta-curcumene cyclase
MFRCMTLLMGLLCIPVAWSLGTAPAESDAQVRAQARRLTQRGAAALLAAQEADGGWDAKSGPGITCLVLTALIQEPTVGPTHPAVRRGLEFVRRFMHDDGGIYSAEGFYKTYETSVALSMFAALGPAARPKEVAALQRFLKENQWDEGEGKSRDDPWYGGAGYGHGQRPDLSNTQMMLEALHDSGLPKDDPTYQKALVFIQRCQMLAESNDQPFAKGSTQGGFIYSPANGGESKAGEIENDRTGRRELRAYGTMTYAGFKSMVYAGLKRDDPRVKAALDWIERHWTLDHNPNMPEKQSMQGIFYYYHVFARAFQAWGENEVADKTGTKHVWRHELVAKLAELQHSDGSWVNETERWMEEKPPLATAYAMLALEAAYPEQAPLAQPAEHTTEPAP